MDDGDLIYLGKAAAKSENGHAEYAAKKELREIQGCFGLVFQNFNLFPHYSVLKNIMDAPFMCRKTPSRSHGNGQKSAGENGPHRKENSYPCQRLRRSAAAGCHCPGRWLLNPSILFFDELPPHWILSSPAKSSRSFVSWLRRR